MSGRKWYYEADASWMLARNTVLGATDVVALLPELKRVRKGGLAKIKQGDTEYEYSKACAGIWAEKTADTIPDLFAPSNDAARGHILEPYAVQEFNRLAKANMYHWDDMLIASDDGLGFSPDSLNLEQPMHDGGILPAIAFTDEYTVTKLLEIKSYGAKHHVQMMLEDKMDHPERYQVAVGMVVLPTIENGALMCYNPSAVQQIIIETYTRDELASEIKDVEEILAMYNTTKTTMESLKGWFHAEYSEDQIYEAHIAEMSDTMHLGGGEIGV